MRRQDSGRALLLVLLTSGLCVTAETSTVSAAPETPRVPLVESGLTGVIIYWPLTGKDALPHVQRVIEGSPAQKAGIRVGDVYTHVDGQSLMGLPVDDVMEIIRGRAGTTMRLRVARKDTDKPLYFVIPRESEARIRKLGGMLQRSE